MASKMHAPERPETFEIEHLDASGNVWEFLLYEIIGGVSTSPSPRFWPFLERHPCLLDDARWAS